MHFEALLVRLIYTPIMGLIPFQSIIIFLGLIIVDNGKYIQKLSDHILSGAELKVEGNLTVKFFPAIIVMILGQKVNFKFK